ncbi:MAG: SRPBCC family protein [Gammaproteobacteria bacterium]|nr:SRPBCC family protein [Gammaproteobacteria bacterium]
MRLSLLLAVLLTSVAGATTLVTTDVQHRNGRFHIRFSTIIDAPYERISALMDSYQRWPQWSGFVKQVNILDRPDTNTTLLKLELNTCYLLFCQSMTKIQTVTRTAPGKLLTMISLDRQDFRYARELWQIQASGPRTLLTYDAVLEPAFYIPPIFGPWLVKSGIQKELRRSTQRLEQIARNPEQQL